MTYDAENRMISAQYTDSSLVVHRTEHSYSGDSLLAEMKKYDGGALTSTTRYLRAGFLPVQERDSTNVVNREYTWGLNLGGGIGGLLNLKQNASDYFYLYDGKGNVSNLINSAQVLVANYRYDAFGVLMKKTTTIEQPYMFSTKPYDSGTGLYDFGFRNYMPEPGKWTTRDPLGEEGGINLYQMVGNNPVRWVDPNGLAVTININRTTYTNNSIVGTISVTSTVTNLTFSGYTLENSNPPNSNLPVPPYTHNAFVRTDRTPNRIELFDVLGASNIQIHVGNSASDVTGCFAVGESTSTDWVGGSTNAMNSINDIITADGSGNITVIIGGSTGRP